MTKKKISKVTVGLIQMKMVGDVAANLERGKGLVEEAAERGAQIVCLPELFRSLYIAQSEDASQFQHAETIPGPSTQTLSRVAKSKKVVIIAPLFEKRAQGVYHNSAVVIDADGALLGTYRKMHIPDDPLYFEKYYFAPGDLGFKSFQTHFGKIGVLICWDQWFPEAARLTALSGAQILFYPTAIGRHPDDSQSQAEYQRSAWQVVQRGHAVSNGTFVACANRTGREDQLHFWGSSFVSDPFGAVIAESKKNTEEILMCECDLAQIDETREGWPFLRDRRVDAYQLITSRYLDDTHTP
jgi:N-carbamoylputrescine amidase